MTGTADHGPVPSGLDRIGYSERGVARGWGAALPYPDRRQAVAYQPHSHSVTTAPPDGEWTGASGVRLHTNSVRRRAVERVIAAIRARYREPLTAYELAQIAFFSQYHFDRFFRDITGVSPGRFLAATRIEAAKRLLLTTQYSISGIAFEIGYSSIGTFTRQFTAFVGVQPGRFRREGLVVATDFADGLVAAADSSREDSAVHGLRVRVRTPPAFSGSVVIGLFATPVARCRPSGCAVTRGSGVTHIEWPETDAVYLRAVGFDDSVRPLDALLCSTALRGGAGPITLHQGRTAVVDLRAPSIFDPPILFALPFMLSERAGPPTVGDST